MTQAYGSGRNDGPAVQDSDSMTDQASDMAAQGREKADEMAGQARHKADEMAGQAKDQVENARERAADGTESAADKIREQAEGRGGMQEKVGVKAADAMERTAGYLRDKRTDDIWHDVENVARDHPMQALGGAIIAGFVIGRILR